ncbi:MAG: collagen-like protein [Marinifilaceae bacterium]|nr:collagen-like protein [Marinifilaceae bacterium]
MKTSKLYFFAVAFMALSISMVSCSGDDGEAGLLGPKGDKGEQGAAGEVGSAGTDGSIIYSGEGEPAATVGTTSDYYLDVATGMLYGPKVNADNWTDTDGFSLKGTNGTNGADGTNGTNGVDGTNGTNGSKILSGEGVPDNTIGNTSDFYLNKTSYVLYGPAVTNDEGDTNWGAGLELKGADGNANVKSYLFSVLENQWILNADKNLLYAYDQLISLSDKITDNVVESGVVLVYRIDANDHAILLPNSNKTTSGNLLTESFRFGGQDICYMARELFTFANVEEILSKETFNYRAVIITGELANQMTSKANDQISFEAAALEMGIVE